MKLEKIEKMIRDHLKNDENVIEVDSIRSSLNDGPITEDVLIHFSDINLKNYGLLIGEFLRKKEIRHTIQYGDLDWMDILIQE